ncbi:sec1 family domain-containing protein 1 [Nematocida homosporus]|uniref:sec1 family domain-containing protein 1 n=1 Tax=Nematocida homosporus TaxID=1912981 RepID=UPI0022210479|nr:sec1 family domain-containing protein 1 [Nematocida homosporus]KAI5185087.1 sec1 family domain-containing protein 1 [Nematocida homosporus]
MLRKRLLNELERILKKDEFEWSVLVLDKIGQDVIAPLFRMSDLMEMGIVQCLRLEEERPKVVEARAVYLVAETAENCGIIAKDITGGWYRSVEVIFTGVVGRSEFESLAQVVGAQGESRRVRRVMDGLVRLSMVSERFYSLNLEGSFMAGGEEVSAAIKLGILSLLRGLENPVILSEAKYMGLGESIMNRAKELGVKGRPGKRSAAVVILGREMDLITPVEHGWTYGSLVVDLLGYDLNKVTIPGKMVRTDGVSGGDEGSDVGEDKVFDLNRFDQFWAQNQNEYFPTVAERVEQELGEYKADLAQRSIDSSSSKETISQALAQVPELSQKNKQIHTHMTIALSLVEEIKKQKLDEIVGLENDTSKIAEIKDELEDLLPKVSAENFLRALAVLTSRFPEESGYLEGLARKKGCAVEVLRFLAQSQEESTSERRSIVSTAATSLFRNIKRILPLKKKMPITVAVQDILNRRTNYQAVELYPNQNLNYASVHVFMIGGGTFTEYKSLMELAEETGIEITYGATEILVPSKFLARIAEILATK